MGGQRSGTSLSCPQQKPPNRAVTSVASCFENMGVWEAGWPQGVVKWPRVLCQIALGKPSSWSFSLDWVRSRQTVCKFPRLATRWQESTLVGKHGNKRLFSMSEIRNFFVRTHQKACPKLSICISRSFNLGTGHSGLAVCLDSGRDSSRDRNSSRWHQTSCGSNGLYLN